MEKEKWKNQSILLSAGMTLRKGAYVDNIEEDAAIVFC